MVTGGSFSDYLDSTELLLPSATSWSYTAALPSARGELWGATLDNKIVITGIKQVSLTLGVNLSSVCLMFESDLHHP